MTATLFTPFALRSVTLRNRIVVSPMCQYSSVDGFASDWHLVHLGSRAVGGAGAVISEAAAVSPDGRISPSDLGIWKDEHVQPLRRITQFIAEHGSVPGIQLAHAGRKASVAAPWRGGGALDESEGGWRPLYAPSAQAFSSRTTVPVEMTHADIQRIIGDFRRAATRARDAGFQIIELHGAHGYLLHEFLSPLSNLRTDDYGGSFENRIRFLLDTVDAVRSVWPNELPLFVRLSSTDWTEGGWNIAQSTELARILHGRAVDLVDASSGGNVAGAKIPIGPGYQVSFAEAIKRDAGIATGAVGLITDAHQADEIIRSGKADVVILARELLRDPYWPLRAARELGVKVTWPEQYQRAEL
ncbi:MAG: NADH:flavin oxidoreductase/NADH oxidase [Gemmatimonadota bacterium]|nr:NADH:flavin oxidoreductase/NADH oxidase [Gemmatimonadota bacterium]